MAWRTQFFYMFMDNNNQTQTKISLWQKIALVLFGLLLAIIILETGLRLGGFIVLSIQEHRNWLSMQKKGAYRIMCLGESTTWNQYPKFLEKILNERNIGLKFSVIDKGVAGAKTSLILARLKYNLDAYHPDMVITMMGINDFGKHMPDGKGSLNPKPKTPWQSLKVYKLSRLLWLHLETKLQGLGKSNNQISLFPQQGQSQPEEILFKQAIALNPGEPAAYIDLAWFYQEQGRFSDAEALLKQAIALNPRMPWVYNELARVYQVQGKFSDADALLKQAIALNPRKFWAYTDLAWVYQVQGRFSDAEALLKQTIALNPGEPAAYTDLAQFYQEQGRFSDAEALLKQAIALNPRKFWAYTDLAWVYQEQGRFSEAEALYKQAIALNPGKSWAYNDLARFYQEQGRFSEAEALYKQAIALNPGEARILYRSLRELYLEIGNSMLAGECGKKLQELRLADYNLVTMDNYRKLKSILDKRGIVYVCVQYPMRGIGPLKKIFQDNAEGVVFVDNERIFRDALKQERYKDYFVDSFGGDFGHCTPKGNNLLAANIANVIIKEVFGK